MNTFYLQLVNADNPVRMVPKSDALLSAHPSCPDIFLERHAALALRALLTRLRAFGSIVLVSGMRTMADQQAIWDFSLKEHGADYTRKFVALPGCSEHQTGLLFLAGLGGDSWYGLVSRLPGAEAFYETVLSFSSYTRNGLFFAPFFLCLGLSLSRSRHPSGAIAAPTLALAVSLLAMSVEAVWLHSMNCCRHDSIYLFLPPVMVSLFSLLCRRLRQDYRHRANSGKSKPAALRDGGRRFLSFGNPCGPRPSRQAGVKNMKTTKETNYKKEELLFQNRPETARAWIAIDPAALAHNLSVLRSLLSPDCRIMAVVKANAYGHGDLETARRLSSLGVDSFAVATLDEAVRLRKVGISGEILILGFTPAFLTPVLWEYRLTQTVVSLSHARSFCRARSPVRVHVAVDTGMHRLGIPVRDTDGVCQALSMPWLKADGLFTHLCAADSPLPEDRAFTLRQIRSFEELTEQIRTRGLPVPPLHYQSSYGILNYPLKGPKAAWARPGILLYGCLSENAEEKRQNLSLRPVLSLFARVVCVRAVSALETVGYGRTYRAPSLRKIAVLSIGYADGIPRSLSGKGYVLLHGKKAPVVGRICMDQMIVDVTGIPEAACGNIAVLIGQSHSQRILAEDLAGWAGTITNELLSRLGSRLPRLSPEKDCSGTSPGTL